MGCAWNEVFQLVRASELHEPQDRQTATTATTEHQLPRGRTFWKPMGPGVRLFPAAAPGFGLSPFVASCSANTNQEVHVQAGAGETARRFSLSFVSFFFPFVLLSFSFSFSFPFAFAFAFPFHVPFTFLFMVLFLVIFPFLSRSSTYSAKVDSSGICGFDGPRMCSAFSIREIPLKEKHRRTTGLPEVLENQASPASTRWKPSLFYFVLPPAPSLVVGTCWRS